MPDESLNPPGADDSRRLMLRAKGGDRKAFDVVVKRYANMVVGLAFKLLGSRDEALDCAQDAFVKAWENVARYDPKWSVATWLRRVVTNLALDRLRRRRSSAALSMVIEETFASDEAGPSERAEKKERSDVVREIIELLPEKYRTVLILRDMEGVDIADIALVTGTNAATVRWRLHRARALFRERWLAISSRE